MKTIQIQIEAGDEFCGDCELCRADWWRCQKFGDLEQVDVDMGGYDEHQLKRHPQCLAAEQTANLAQEELSAVYMVGFEKGKQQAYNEINEALKDE